MPSMAVQRKHSLTGVGIPDFDSLVIAAAGNPPAIRTEYRAKDESCVSFECEILLASFGVPKLRIFCSGDSEQLYDHPRSQSDRLH